MPLMFSLEEAVQRTKDAWLRLSGENPDPFPLYIRWVTTSAEPCIYCVALEQLSAEIFVGFTRKFPQVIFGDWHPQGRADLIFVKPGDTFHRNCQCKELLFNRTP